jgi:four helix bundle protein
MPVKDFRELIVWQKAMDLVEMTYRATEQFPKQELYGLTSQMQRAAVSIPSNIAEGQARTTMRDFMHFLAVSYGSLKELETQTPIAERLGFIDAVKCNTLIQSTTEVARLLSGLNNSNCKRKLGSLVNEADIPSISSFQPGVNAGPNNAYAGMPVNGHLLMFRFSSSKFGIMAAM